MVEQLPQSPGTPDRRSDDATADLLGAARAELAALRLQFEHSERECRASQERERLLRNEARHRVRNLLAVIRLVFSRTVNSGHSLDDIGDHFRGRLDALARFHSPGGLHRGDAIDLEDMIRDELRSFEFDERIEIEGPSVSVPNDVAQLLGLALHELATNSIKFGALSSTDARMHLTIRWTSADGALALNWKETGTPVLASAPIRNGFGRELIEQALPYQLSATSSFELLPGGLECAMAIPLQVRNAENLAPLTWS